MLSLAEAASRVGKSKPTLQRAIKAGRLSASRDEHGAYLIDPAELARRVDGYRLQGGAYALAVRATTGEAVARVCFAFLTPSGAVEIDLDDVDAAVAEVESLVASGSELETA